MTELKNTPPQIPFNILLIGDDCLDVYQFGTVNRLSPEAPVPVLKLTHKQKRPGMARNVKVNLENLGCTVSYLHGKSSVKTRLIDERSNQHIVRLDEDVISNTIEIPTELPQYYDAIVISDYNKGTISYEVVEELRKNFKGPIFIDTKKTDLQRFNGCFIKINELEFSKITSNTSDDKLIVTLGGEGVMHNGKNYEAPDVEVVDVTGAGDTFLSALTFGYLKDKDMDKAINFAIKASSITVQKMGVYAPKLEEIECV